MPGCWASTWIDAFDWSRVVVVTADDIPGDNVVSLIQDDQPVLVPVGGEIRHQAEPVALIAAADRATLREARTTSPSAPSGCRRSSTRSRRAPEFAQFTVEAAMSAAAMAEAEMVIEGTYRVGHQEQLYIENQAMIAVPRADGGVTIHGSLQCPYYIHKAMKRALKLTDEQAVVIQAETGGGFGGKEEYPSIIALHAALLALKCRQAGAHDLRPPRGHQRHDQAPPGRRPLPHRRHARRPAGRPGDRGGHGRRRLLHPDAGGAVARHAPRRRPVPLPERAHHRPGDGHQHAAQRRLPRLRRPADRVRRRDAGQPHRRGAGRVAARAAPALGLPRGRRDAHRPGPARERRRRRGAGGGRRGSRASSASAATPRQAREAASGVARGGASGIGLALAWHGAGFTGSGEVKLAAWHRSS